MKIMSGKLAESFIHERLKAFDVGGWPGFGGCTSL